MQPVTCAPMVTSGLLGGRISTRVEWRSAFMISGGQYVTTCGAIRMLQLFANSRDSSRKVLSMLQRLHKSWLQFHPCVLHDTKEPLHLPMHTMVLEVVPFISTLYNALVMKTLCLSARAAQLTVWTATMVMMSECAAKVIIIYWTYKTHSNSLDIQ